jgi:ribonuclease T2
MRALVLAALAWVLSAACRADEAGRFDYYLLTLSWAPAFCASHGQRPDAGEECGSKRFGFVVHGLWPQFKRGFPQSCSTSTPELPEQVVEEVLPIMPSHQLIEHEWRKHGTCSGLDAEGYFGLLEQLFAGLSVPDRFDAPEQAFSVAPKEVRRAFLEANPSLAAQGVVVPCSGKWLEEVQICFDKAGSPMACGTDVAKKSCKRSKLVVRPLR